MMIQHIQELLSCGLNAIYPFQSGAPEPINQRLKNTICFGLKVFNMSANLSEVFRTVKNGDLFLICPD